VSSAVITERLKAAWTPLVLIAVVVMATVVTGSIDAQPSLINLILVVGLYVFAGNSGVFSFGQIAFMALGAFACAILTMPVATKEILLPQLPHLLQTAHLGTTPAVLVAGAFTAVVGFAISVPLMRLSGLAAGIATLALLVIVNDFLTNADWLTGGSGNLSGVPTDMTEGTLLVWLAVAILAAFVYQRSRFGRRLRASREDEIAARAIGVRVEFERRVAWTLSALITGIAGALYSHYLGSISPQSFYLSTTFLVAAMLVVGGMHSLRGAVTGGILVAVISTSLDRWENGDSVFGLSLNLPAGTRQIAMGLIVILVLILRPEGLARGREVPWPRMWRRTPLRPGHGSADTVGVADDARR
jgi:branched-chain amino acid transport system permease protein